MFCWGNISVITEITDIRHRAVPSMVRSGRG